MTINVFDLAQNQGLLVELGEEDINKVFGGAGSAGAVDASMQEMQQSLRDQVELSNAMTQMQSEMSAAQVKSSVDQAVSRNTAQTAQQIK
ncbi:MAG: hypothetical protein RLZZ574_470 [Cyanobacteriota bacterium]